MQLQMNINKWLSSPLVRLTILQMVIAVALCAHQDSRVNEFQKMDDWESGPAVKLGNGGESLVLTDPCWGDRVCRINGRPLAYAIDLTNPHPLQLDLTKSAYWGNATKPYQAQNIGLTGYHFSRYKSLHDLLAEEGVFVVRNSYEVKSLLCVHDGEWSEYYATPQADGQLELTIKPLTVDRSRLTNWNGVTFRQTRIDTASQVNAITAKLRTNFKKRPTQAPLTNTIVNNSDMFPSVWTAFRRALQNGRASSPPHFDSRMKPRRHLTHPNGSKIFIGDSDNESD